jgi:hypothetical protein
MLSSLRCKLPSVSILAFKIALLCSCSAQADEQGYRIPVPDKTPEGFEDISSQHSFHDLLLNNVYISTIDVGDDFLAMTMEQRDVFLLEKAQHYVRKVNSSLDLFALYKEKSLVVEHDKLNHKVQLFITIKEKEISEKVGFSWKSDVNGSTSFNFTNGKNDHAVNFVNTLSFNDKTVNASFSTQSNDTGVSILSFSHEAGKDRAIYGVFNPVYHAYTRLGFNSVAGFEYQRNAIGRESSQSRTPLMVTLTQDAIVRVERNGALVKVAKLKAGENYISTDDLPKGDYPVELVITYYDGRVDRQEAIIESSLSNMSTEGFAGFFVGYNNNQQFFDFNNITDRELIFSTSYGHVLGEGVNAFYNVSYQNGIALNPTLLYRVGRQSHRFSLKHSPRETEIFADVRYSFEKGMFNLRYFNQRIEGDNAFNKTHRIETNYHYRTQGYGSLFAGHTYNAVSKKHLLSLVHNKELYRGRTHSLSLGTSLRHGEETVIGFNLTYQLTPRDSDYRYSSVIDHRQNTFFRQTLTQRKEMAAMIVNNRLSVLTGDDFNTGFIQSSLNSERYGYANIEVGSIEGLGGRSNYFNTNFNMQFVGNDESAALIGRKHVDDGVMIDLSDDSHEDTYELSVNQRKIALKGGRSHLVDLTPHDGYALTLVNKTNPYIRVVGGEKQVYIHKNNIFIPDWKKGKVSFIYGRAIFNGEALVNAHLTSSVSQGFTDEKGFFTLEVIDGDDAININGKPCAIDSIDKKQVTLSCDNL